MIIPDDTSRRTRILAGAYETRLSSLNPYETQELVDQYLAFHYAEPGEYLTWEAGPATALDFAVRTVREGFDLPGVSASARALDVGCAVGRSSFELSAVADEVIGIDFSAAFVEAAEAIRRDGDLSYRILVEGSSTVDAIAKRPDVAHADRVRFEVGDATALRPDLGSFDLVHAANLICRLPEPKKFLSRLPELVRAGGHLVLTTPCTWLGEFTRPEFWPEGPTLEWLESELGGAFELEFSADVPFLIRETARKFQWTVSQLSRWRRIA